MTVIAVIGPSGSGKSSLVRELHRRGLVRVHPTWTTRPRRADELPGAFEHRFVTDDLFDRLCAREFFLATATPFGLAWRYGLPPLLPGSRHTVDVVMLRAPVVDQMRVSLGLTFVVHVEDTPDRMARRLLARGSDTDEISARLRDNRHEVALGRTVADVTLQNAASIDRLADSAAAVIDAHTLCGAVR